MNGNVNSPLGPAAPPLAVDDDRPCLCQRLKVDRQKFSGFVKLVGCGRLKPSEMPSPKGGALGDAP